jgi:hypothetical protein
MKRRVRSYYRLDVRVVKVERVYEEDTEYNSETRQNDVKLVPIGDRLEAELMHHIQTGNDLDGTIDTVKSVLDLLKASKHVDAD